MPIYEYQCKGCGHEFEREQRISEAPIKKCPSCGAAKARRQISRTSFVLKGGGWYSDLYGTAKPGSADKGEATKSGESKSADAAPTASSSESQGAATGKSEPSATSDGGGKGDSPGKGPKKGGKGAKAAA